NRMTDRIENMKATFRSCRVHRLVGDLGDVWKVALGHPKDAFSIVCAGNLLGEERLVVADIGPTEHIVEHRVFEEFSGEIDSARGLIGNDEDSFPVLFDLIPAIGPKERIDPTMVVAKPVA